MIVETKFFHEGKRLYFESDTGLFYSYHHEASRKGYISVKSDVVMFKTTFRGKPALCKEYPNLRASSVHGKMSNNYYCVRWYFPVNVSSV